MVSSHDKRLTVAERNKLVSTAGQLRGGYKGPYEIYDGEKWVPHKS